MSHQTPCHFVRNLITAGVLSAIGGAIILALAGCSAAQITQACDYRQVVMPGVIAGEAALSAAVPPAGIAVTLGHAAASSVCADPSAFATKGSK